jgi:flagellar hook-basal body complex protein FliE
MADASIHSIGAANLSAKLKPQPKPAEQADTVSFGQWLNRSLDSINQLQQDAGEAARNLATGKTKDIHGTMIAMQKADIATNLMIEVRNKLLSAYDEIKRMQF